MLDVRMDLCHILEADSKLFTTSRKVVTMDFHTNEDWIIRSKGKKREVISPRTYTQSAAILRKIGRFFRDMNDKTINRYQKEAADIRKLAAGGIVITIWDKVAEDKYHPAITYSMMIKNGQIMGYHRHCDSSSNPTTYPWKDPANAG